MSTSVPAWHGRGMGQATLPQAGCTALPSPATGETGAATAGPCKRPGQGEEVSGQCWRALLLFLPTPPNTRPLGPVLACGCSPCDMGCAARVSSSSLAQARPLPRQLILSNARSPQYNSSLSNPSAQESGEDHTCRRKGLGVRRRTFFSLSWALVAHKLPAFHVLSKAALMSGEAALSNYRTSLPACVVLRAAIPGRELQGERRSHGHTRT